MFENVLSIKELVAERALAIKEANGDVKKIMEINQDFATIKSLLQRQMSVDLPNNDEYELSPIDINTNIIIDPKNVGAEYIDDKLVIRHPLSYYAINVSDSPNTPQVTNSFRFIVESVLKFSIK